MLSLKASATEPPFFSDGASRWADSVLATLSLDERVAQLFMVSAWSNKDSNHVAEIDSLVSQYKIGGLTFFQGGPIRQARLTNYYQSKAKVPLLISIDGEYGLAMRIDSTIRFPRQMTMSAMNDTAMIYKMGVAVARHCNRIGIHCNFAPVLDINNNPSNPVIGSRSFGDEREMVTNSAMAYMRGMQDNHVLASGKHFPGHGDTDTDSHFSLPVIDGTVSRLDSLELYPFRKLMENGLGSVMVAHLFIPAYDTSVNLPSTLSKKIVTDLLQHQLNYKGLIFTDALNMKGVASFYKPGEVDKLALLAGNDILLLTEDVPKALIEIRHAVELGEITQEEIDRRVKKLLMVKYWAGLNNYKPIDETNLVEDLNSPEDLLLQQQLYEKSLTLLSNPHSILPLSKLESLKIASLVIGDTMDNVFQQQLQRYAPVANFEISKNMSLDSIQLLYKSLAEYNLILVSIHNTNMNVKKGYGISDTARQFLDTLFQKQKCILINFGNSYTLSRLLSVKQLEAIVLAYEDMPVTQSLAAQLVFGGISISGRLPVQSNEYFEKNAGITSPQQVRLKYSLPEDAGLSSAVLHRIDSIVNDAIVQRAFPGCQVLVARNQKVVYSRSFGYHTYDSLTLVKTDDLYDIASVTKIAGTSLAMMKLMDGRTSSIDLPLSKGLPKLKKTNKKSQTVREVMAHQAGFVTWIPFWKKTMTGSGPSGAVYRHKPDAKYSVKVADSMYMNEAYVDSLWKWIYTSPLGERGKYVYSDLGPLLLEHMIERKTDIPFDTYLDKNFYKPLGLHNLTFNPKLKFDTAQLIPTENDTIFRKQLIQGTVHDPAAAMLGGVAGNAGIFSDANSLAVLMQMLLNNGTYGNQKYIDSATVHLFTSKAYQSATNRRGLLFDKPETDTTKASPTCRSASALAFGHQGFTGTCVWVDPQYDLIYVFLSNRINPDVSNDKLMKLNVRTNIQQVIYDSIIK